MSDVKNIWVLKQPIEVDTAVTTTGKWFGFDGKVLTCMNEEMFAELFQPLDVESLTTQLDNILQGYGARQYQRGFKGALENPLSNEPIPRDKELDAETLAEVLELIGITKDEQ